MVTLWFQSRPAQISICLVAQDQIPILPLCANEKRQGKKGSSKALPTSN